MPCSRFKVYRRGQFIDHLSLPLAVLASSLSTRRVDSEQSSRRERFPIAQSRSVAREFRAELRRDRARESELEVVRSEARVRGLVGLAPDVLAGAGLAASGRGARYL